jgi:hypothetical protein
MVRLNAATMAMSHGPPEWDHLAAVELAEVAGDRHSGVPASHGTIRRGANW